MATDPNVSSGKAQLEALLDLINTSARNAIVEYEKSGHGVPSPDSQQAHPLDSSSSALALRKTIRVLESACETLCTTLAPTGHTVLNRALGQIEPPCLRVVAEAGIADILAGNADGLHVDEIAQKSGIEGGKLSRILRILATRGCFREVRPDVFANNRLSLVFQDAKPSTAMVAFLTDEVNKSASVLYETLSDPEYGSSYQRDKSSFMYARKEEKAADVFAWFEQHPSNMQRFQLGMTGWNNMTAALGVLTDFPWSSLPQGTTLCDVGSGVGSFTMPLAKAYPHLRLTLQDLPGPIERAKSVWAKDCPEAIAEQRVEFVPFDFFKGPPVEGQDIYYVKQVTHAFSDADAQVLFNNVSKAMNAKSRLFIHDYVLHQPYQTKKRTEQDGSSDTETAPWPLLENYGTGNIRPYYMDLVTLIMQNARERTLQQFIAMGLEAGLKFVKFWDFAETTLVEFRLKDA